MQSLSRRRPARPALACPAVIHLALSCLACLASLVGAAGCDRAAVDPDRPPVQRPDEPRALLYQFEADVVAPARAGDVAGVRRALEALLATPADFEALFGPAQAQALYPGFKERVATPFLAEAPEFIVGRVKAGDTEVKVRLVGPALPADTVPGDQITLDAMTARLPMMSLWLSAPGKELGLRLEGFVYREGRFVTLLKLHREITRLAEEKLADEKRAAEEAAEAAEALKAPD